MAKTKKVVDELVNRRFIDFFSENGFKIPEVSEMTGLTQEVFYQIRSNRNNPSAETLQLCKEKFNEFGFSTDYVFTGEDVYKNLGAVIKELTKLKSDIELLKNQLAEKDLQIEELKADKKAFRSMIPLDPDSKSFYTVSDVAQGLELDIEVDNMGVWKKRQIIGFQQGKDTYSLTDAVQSRISA